MKESDAARQAADIGRGQGAAESGQTEHGGSGQEQTGKGTDQGQWDVPLHSWQLAIFCLRVINAELTDDIPSTGYLVKGDDIPVISISGHLQYACEFLMECLCNRVYDYHLCLSSFYSYSLIII